LGRIRPRLLSTETTFHFSLFPMLYPDGITKRKRIYATHLKIKTCYIIASLFVEV